MVYLFGEHHATLPSPLRSLRTGHRGCPCRVTTQQRRLPRLRVGDRGVPPPNAVPEPQQSALWLAPGESWALHVPRCQAQCNVPGVPLAA